MKSAVGTTHLLHKVVLRHGKTQMNVGCNSVKFYTPLYKIIKPKFVFKEKFLASLLFFFNHRGNRGIHRVLI